MKITGYALIAVVVTLSMPYAAHADSSQLLPPTPLGSTAACPPNTQQMLVYSGTQVGGGQAGINCVPISATAAGDLIVNSLQVNDTPTCDANHQGVIKFDGVTKTFKGCNGTGWVSFSSSSGYPVNHGSIWAIGKSPWGGGMDGLQSYCLPPACFANNFHHSCRAYTDNNGNPWLSYDFTPPVQTNMLQAPVKNGSSTGFGNSIVPLPDSIFIACTVDSQGVYIHEPIDNVAQLPPYTNFVSQPVETVTFTPW